MQAGSAWPVAGKLAAGGQAAPQGTAAPKAAAESQKSAVYARTAVVFLGSKAKNRARAGFWTANRCANRFLQAVTFVTACKKGLCSHVTNVTGCTGQTCTDVTNVTACKKRLCSHVSFVTERLVRPVHAVTFVTGPQSQFLHAYTVKTAVGRRLGRSVTEQNGPNHGHVDAGQALGGQKRAGLMPSTRLKVATVRLTAQNSKDARSWNRTELSHRSSWTKRLHHRWWPRGMSPSAQ